MPRDLYMRYYIITLGAILLDQLTKILIRANFAVGESVPVLGDFFKLTYIRNDGAAFSMLSGAKVFLIVLPLVAIGLAIWYMERHRRGEHFTLPLALSLIIGGGIGNLIDRIAFGEVTDMFDFSIFPPIFNVADIAVCVGCAFLILYVLFFDRKAKE